eukprot:scaffold10714_cov157-Isochrysis_galbana.AAC.3
MAAADAISQLSDAPDPSDGRVFSTRPEQTPPERAAHKVSSALRSNPRPPPSVCSRLALGTRRMAED